MTTMVTARSKLLKLLQINLMKNIFILLASVAIAGCSLSEAEETVAPIPEKTVEEINAERGDPCDCIDESLLAIDVFFDQMNAGAFKTSIEFNAEFSLTMQGCMQPLGHGPADVAWNSSMTECESFSVIREMMIMIQNSAEKLKVSEQEDFVSSTSDEGANGVLDRLQKGAN